MFRTGTLLIGRRVQQRAAIGWLNICVIRERIKIRHHRNTFITNEDEKKGKEKYRK